MRRIWFATLLLVSLIAGACAGSGSANDGEGDSGITGVVLLGPQCPVVTVESPCPDEPTEASVQVSNADGTQVIKLVRTDANGRFRIELEPGDYMVQAIPLDQSGIQFSKPQNVTVVTGQFLEVNVGLDTGIR